MTNYQPFPMTHEISVDSIVTVHYFQFARGFLFPGERHDFWEFVYMDKGEAEIGADSRRFILMEGEAVFHKPDEFHTIWAGGQNPPDIVVISFLCTSPAMSAFYHQRLTVPDDSKLLIAQIVREAGKAWSNDLAGDYAGLTARPEPAIGAVQMVSLSLEMLLINLLRSLQSQEAGLIPDHPASSKKKAIYSNKEYRKGIMLEMNDWIILHLDEKITIPILCERARISPTVLKRIFRQEFAEGVNEHLSRLRHEEARRLIRDGRVSMKAIAGKCGYGSIHYFSRKFHRMEGMTPSEYARSVKSKTQF